MKKIIKQLISMYTLIYTITTALFSFSMMMDGVQVQAKQYLMLLGMFAVLWLITCFRALLDQWQWGLRQHFLLKRILFSPVYLGVTLVTMLNFGYPFENTFKDALFIIVVFTISFVIILILSLPIVKKQEEQFDQMLQAYQESIKEE